MTRNYQSYMTASRDCDIIPGRERQESFIHLENKTDLGHWTEINAMFLERGYWMRFLLDYDEDKRRHILHTTYNKAACGNCQSCKPSRINLGVFDLTSQQQDLISEIPLLMNAPKHVNAEEHIDLASRYQLTRHATDSNKDGMRQYWSVKKRISNCLEFRDETGTLVAGVLYQQTGPAAAGDLCYYDMDRIQHYPKLPLYLKLQMALHLKSQNIEYMYLGAWTQEPSAYSPKARLRGFEIFEDEQWQPLSSKERKTSMAAYFKQFPSDLPGPT